MAKRIKLQDRSGVQLLPLTRSELVQVSEISGLDLLNSKSWQAATVQDVLEKLSAYVSAVNQAEGNNLTALNILKDKLNSFAAEVDSVKNYVDTQDTAYLALAYAQSASDAAAAQANAYAEAAAKASEAQINSYAEATSKATAAETAAKNYADGKFLVNVKLNNDFVEVQTDTNGRYVDLGSIATSTGLQTLSDKVDAIAAAYITTTASEAADSAIITAYQNADSAIITAYQAADTALSGRIDALETSYVVTLDDTATPGEGILKVYTIKQGGTSIGTINIPKDLVATSGELVYCTKSGNTYTEVPSTTDGAKAYIKMTIQNGDPFYIDVASLIEYNDVDDTTEILLDNTNHVITATVGTIAATKISYNDTTVDAALTDLYSQIGAGGSVTTQIENAINALDGSYTASGTAAHSGTYVMNAVTQTDGKIVSIGSVEVEAAGAAATAKGTIDNYTVNGKKISTSPVLYAGDIAMSSTDATTTYAAITALQTADSASVKTVNGQSPATGGAVTVNANQIDTVNQYKIGSDSAATTHKVDEVLAAAVLYVDTTGNGTYADTTI